MLSSDKNGIQYFLHIYNKYWIVFLSLVDKIPPEKIVLLMTEDTEDIVKLKYK